MADHECKEDDSCCCGIVALEPHPRCPRHGGERGWPPRCATCGQFLPIPFATPDQPEANEDVSGDFYK